MNNKRYLQVTRQHPGSRQSGFSLLEVLIAVVILSVGLLGLAGMQVTSLKYVTSSLQRTQATSLAYDILDRIRANPNGIYITGLAEPASAGRFSGQSTACFGAVTCSANTMMLFDLVEWKTAIEALLPNGQGQVAVPGGTTQVTIQIKWEDKRDLQNASAVERFLTIQMKSEL